MNKLVVPDDAPLAAIELDALLERAADYGRESKSPATRAAYERQWRKYAVWCKDLGADAMGSAGVDLTMVMRYVAWMADRGAAVSTVLQALAAIAHQQRAHGFTWAGDSYELQSVLAGVKRTIGVRPNQKAPIEELELRKMVATCKTDKLIDLRDKALLLTGWVGAFRRSELVALDVRDITFVEDGFEALVRKSKTDQEGEGLVKAIPYAHDDTVCAVRSMKAWLERAGITEGAVFRRLGRADRLRDRLSGQAVAKLVKSRCEQCGIDPERYAGHSLRSGFITTAADHDKPLDAIMQQTGQRAPSTVLGYIRRADRFKKNAAKDIL